MGLDVYWSQALLLVQRVCKQFVVQVERPLHVLLEDAAPVLALRAQDLGPALRQPGDGHFQAVIDEVDIGACAVVAVHDALRD